MGTVLISKTAQQAFEWLGKMGIEVRPAIDSAEMYEFEYDGTLLLIAANAGDDKLSITAPVYLPGETDARNKEIYDTAEYMTREDLKDFIVEYVNGALSYVSQVYTRPVGVYKLRRYQLLHMLDEMVEAYHTLLVATMVVAAPLDDWQMK